MLEAGVQKISHYYECIVTSDAHIIAMSKWSCNVSYLSNTCFLSIVLNPHQKLNYICANWSKQLANKATKHAELIVSYFFLNHVLH